MSIPYLAPLTGWSKARVERHRDSRLLDSRLTSDLIHVARDKTYNLLELLFLVLFCVDLTFLNLGFFILKNGNNNTAPSAFDSERSKERKKRFEN